MTQWGLDTLFNPAKRHMDDEKRRLLATREEAGDSSGGKRIDLASGKVVIRREDADDEADADRTAEDVPGGEAAGKRGKRAGKAPKSSDETTAPSAAAIRAAKRRGRSI